MHKEGQYHLGGTRAWVAVGGWSVPSTAAEGLAEVWSIRPWRLCYSCTLRSTCFLLLGTLRLCHSWHSWCILDPTFLYLSCPQLLLPNHPTHPPIDELSWTKMNSDFPRPSKTISDQSPVPPSKRKKNRQMNVNKDEQTKRQKVRKSERQKDKMTKRQKDKKRQQKDRKSVSRGLNGKELQKILPPTLSIYCIWRSSIKWIHHNK